MIGALRTSCEAKEEFGAQQEDEFSRSACTTAEDEGGRSKIKRVIDSADCPPTSISLAYIEQCTDNFASENRLGHGAFGEVYRGIDRVLNVSFAVKRIRCELQIGANKENLKSIKRQFEQEIETLTYFRHPNVARLFAHCLDDDIVGLHCLVYELAQRGSLDKFFQDDTGRAKLPWYRRLHIALDVSKALCYLHKGGSGLKCYHRDLKSANICLSRNYSAKLIDCGLSKLIAEEGSQSAMTLSKCATGSSVMGTRGYICPKYNRTAKFTSESEIFSFGIVLAELATGIIQNSTIDGVEMDFFDRYIDDDEPVPLTAEFDKCAGSWDDSAVNEFSSIVLECIASRPKDRPTINDVVSRLRSMARKHCELSPSEKARLHYDEISKRHLVQRAASLKEGTCQICFFDGVTGLRCSSSKYSHFICCKCFEEHVLLHACDDSIWCPIRGCSSSSFPENVVSSHITKEALLILHESRTRNRMATAVEMMSQNLEEIQESSHEDVHETLLKIQQGMLSLASGRCSCPALFIVVPRDKPESFAEDPKEWFVSVVQNTYYLHFLCGRDLTPINSRIEVVMTREWVRKLLPVLKVALVAIQLSMKVMTTVSPDLLSCIPVNGSNEDKLNALRKAMTPFIEKKESQWAGQMNEIEQDDFREYRDELYPFIERLAQEQNDWRKEMEQVTTSDGIVWVKKEEEHLYSSSTQQTFDLPPSAAHLPTKTVDSPPRNQFCRWCRQKSKRKKNWLILLAIVFAVIVIATLAGLLGKMSASEVKEVPPPQTKWDVLVNAIGERSLSSTNTLSDQSSPQYQAASWLVNDDTSQISQDDTDRLIQRYILAVLYYSMGGNDWKANKHYLTGTHECEWHISGMNGITSCDAEKQVKELRFGRFASNGLKGSIPREVAGLTSLTLLDIRNEKSLIGSLPSEIGKLTTLRELRLASNKLTGEIPSAMGMLTALFLLHLHGNSLVGTLPPTFANLTSLEYIRIEGNDIEGDLSPFCTAWKRIKYFSADLTKVTCPCCCCGDKNSAVPTLPKLSERPSSFPTQPPSVVPAGIGGKGSEPDQVASERPTFFPTNTKSKAPATKLPTSSPGKSLSASPTEFASPGPTLSRFDKVISILMEESVSSGSSLREEKSPQYQSAKWLATDDKAVIPLDDIKRVVQRYVVAVFYYSTGGTDWRNQLNFLTERHECDWNTRDNNGVAQCNKEEEIEALIFDDMGLSGYLPNEISSLTRLRWLHLIENQVGSTIPNQIGQLTALTHFVVANSTLTSTIPTSIGELTTLTNLQLWDNDLTGSITTHLGKLVALTNLGLAGNKLSGEIPSQLGSMDSLTSLQLWDNAFTGSINSHLGKLVALSNLGLSDNALVGAIPSEFGMLTRLDTLSLSGNKLTGPIPAELGNMEALTSLQLWDNTLTGSITTHLGKLVALNDLGLSRNRLSGKISSEMGNMGALTSLQLWDNALTGSITTHLGKLLALTSLGLSGNNFNGTIPSELANLDKLQFLQLHTNELVGYLPSELGKLEKLEWLELSNNKLSGSIASTIGILTRVTYLNLRNNQLGGTIPSEIGLLTALSTLWLRGNMLTGTLPRSFASLKSATDIRLESNDLSGSIDFLCDALVDIETLWADVLEVSCECCDCCF